MPVTALVMMLALALGNVQFVPNHVLLHDRTALRGLARARAPASAC
jgi:hypothetical protein